MSHSQIAVSFECTPTREITLHDSDTYPSEALIEAIADLEGVEQIELPPLFDAIDPDVLDRIPEQGGLDSDVALCFSYNGWNIFVRGDGSIIIGDPERHTEPTPLF